MNINDKQKKCHFFHEICMPPNNRFMSQMPGMDPGYFFLFLHFSIDLNTLNIFQSETGL